MNKWSKISDRPTKEGKTKHGIASRFTMKENATNEKKMKTSKNIKTQGFLYYTTSYKCKRTEGKKRI